MAIPKRAQSTDRPAGRKEAQLRVFDRAAAPGGNPQKDTARWGPYRDLGRLDDLGRRETLRRDCPRRPVNWRWQRVQIAVDAGERIPQSQNDVQMAAARRFLDSLWRRCGREDDVLDLADREPPFNSILLAMELAAADDELTWLAQARLLTREPFADLSERLGYSPQAIEWFHDLFYCVRDRLDTPTYVLHHAIGPQIHQPRFDDHKKFWKLMGFIGGAKVLDAVAVPLSGAATDPDVIRFFRNEFRMLLRIRASCAARLVEMNGSREAAAFLRAWQRSEAMEARIRSRTVGAATDVDRNVAAFFAELGSYYDTDSEELLGSFDSKPEVSTSSGAAETFQSIDDSYLEDPLLLE